MRNTIPRQAMATRRQVHLRLVTPLRRDLFRARHEEQPEAL
jgi:hypothetical protein